MSLIMGTSFDRRSALHEAVLALDISSWQTQQMAIGGSCAVVAHVITVTLVCNQKPNDSNVIIWTVRLKSQIHPHPDLNIGTMTLLYATGEFKFFAPLAESSRAAANEGRRANSLNPYVWPIRFFGNKSADVAISSSGYHAPFHHCKYIVNGSGTVSST